MDKKPTPRRKRARNSDGSFKGDIPGTKANEAWVAEDISTEVGEKVVEQTVSTTVEGTTQPRNKYGKKDKITPSFGSVKTTFH